MSIPRLVVSKILNRVDNSITAIYDRHSYDSEKTHALEAWSNKLRSIIEEHQNVQYFPKSRPLAFASN
jgi:hypothetical protein